MSPQEVIDALNSFSDADFEKALMGICKSHAPLVCAVIRKHYHLKYVDCLEKGTLRKQVEHAG